MVLRIACVMIGLAWLLLWLGASGRAGAHRGEHATPAAGPTRRSPSGAARLPSATRLFEIYECTLCHRLQTPYRLVGPSLWKLSQRASAEEIRTSILHPDAVIRPGYQAGLMRARLEENGFYQDIERQPAILERLVTYLAGTSMPRAAAAPTPESLPAGMVRVPGGQTRLPDGQVGETQAFAIDAAPVTSTQYAAFIRGDGYTTKRYWERAGWAVVVKRRNRTQPLDWEAQRRHGTRPVVGVTWYEADAYCRWAGKTLPTEAQWQRACQHLPDWYGAADQAAEYWEWTAEAVWKGGKAATRRTPERCTARADAYPALEGQQTGFRCAAASALAR